MRAPEQAIEFHPLDAPLTEILGLKRPALGDGWRQIRYIDRYVRQHLGGEAVVIERHYIDRDYIEDYSAFYSRNLAHVPNHCRRLHFFSEPATEVESSLSDLHAVGSKGDRLALRAACRGYSADKYLGFLVLKPLAGSPVGRTILESTKTPERDGFTRSFYGCRKYRAHLLGLPLTVEEGLAFQQQDRGVSACATTAIWTALQKAGVLEEIPSATPAQITSLASQYSIPFGRALPSEGLSLDQMCQAVRACGTSPSLLKADHFETTRSYLHSALLSGMVPILILRSRKGDQYHAVAAIGMRRHERPRQYAASSGLIDLSQDLDALYVHDDRHGPYVVCTLREKGGLPWLHLEFSDNDDVHSEEWTITHLLVPMHAKIRLSFGGLRETAASKVAGDVRDAQAELRFRYPQLVAKRLPRIQYKTWISRNVRYLESLLIRQRLTPDQLRALASAVAMPRYVGVIRVSSELLDPIYLLVDSTSTEADVSVVAVLLPESNNEPTAIVGRLLAHLYDCLLVSPEAR